MHRMAETAIDFPKAFSDPKMLFGGASGLIRRNLSIARSAAERCGGSGSADVALTDSIKSRLYAGDRTDAHLTASNCQRIPSTLSTDVGQTTLKHAKQLVAVEILSELSTSAAKWAILKRCVTDQKLNQKSSFFGLEEQYLGQTVISRS